MKIGILREGKTPPDKRVPFTPTQCELLKNTFEDLELVVQPSPIRCFSDDLYTQKGIVLQEDLSDCDVLFGVKEVPIKDLMADKHYFFFSHTHKFQEYNRPLLKAMLDNGLKMTDYECLTRKDGSRVLGFGRYAGIVGAYNGFRGLGIRLGRYELKPAHECDDFEELKEELKKVDLPNIKILLTGSGRVARGAEEILKLLELKELNVEEYLSQESFQEPVFCRADADSYVKHGQGKEFKFEDFFKNGGDYVSDFEKFYKSTDMFIAGHFWDQSSPVFFTQEDAKRDDFRIQFISDISCDIADPIPSTLRPSTIADPFYDYNPQTGSEESTFSSDKNISVMAVDNLPCELPKDASKDFGSHLVEEIVPLLFSNDADGIIERATITNGGKLTSNYSYLQDYVDAYKG
ncbi:NAD(P)-dependent oxidoreductase [Sediminitomix flava]|uniref:Alanine dehydrogenase/PNT-like protein n=1 Tax=Sediminitomix flava TaxID=379075 RepID=A0A315ZIG2_SEDFL|nr:NAD(P)-dependent oxidoreductase [Sediminitomix flava]PWJ44504.1 alanine dehydrogenase/PNT-like protein [Sediminitomix flava]